MLAFRLIVLAVLLTIALDVPRLPAELERRPNELGRVMILSYHRIGEREGRWTRTPRGFRDDLEQLWRLGYRLVALGDLLDGRIDLPPGTSPVVMTFDDSSPGQFRYRERDGRLEIDPDSAVGMLEAFAHDHPGFGGEATFYVLPAAAEPHRLFGQPEHEARKLTYLATHGFEIGNHTFWHADLSKYPEATVRKQIALAQHAIQQRVPGYHVRTLALPMGAYPRLVEWAVSGSWQDISYKHDALMMVAGGPAPSPFSRRFDPYRLPRVQAVESAVTAWLHYFEAHPGERFVSDGDAATITIPRRRRSELDDRADLLRLVELD